MNPSRELDAIVAEKIMGISVVWNEPGSMEKRYFGNDKIPCKNSNGENREGFHDNAIPRYSTDIARAFELLKLLQFKYEVQITSMADGEENPYEIFMWQIKLKEHNAKDWQIETNLSTSLPAVICYAMLKAKDKP